VANEALTPKQVRFVQEYLVDLNATQAAIRAGYGEKGAHVAGSRLLRVRKVAEALADAKAHRAHAVASREPQLRAERVLVEVGYLALVDPGDAFDENGSLLKLKQMPEHVRRAIAGVKVKVTEEGASIIDVRFCDKTKTLDLAMRHLGLLKDKVEVSGGGGGGLQIVVQTYKDKEKDK